MSITRVREVVMPIYNVRVTCDYGPGVDDWEYVYVDDQDPLDTTVDCPTHPSATMRDFVILKITPDE